MHASVHPPTLSPEVAALAGKYLTFVLGGEDYGLPVLRVREIIKMLDVTAVPHAPSHVRGVINLRGKVIPVIDLRTRLGCAPRAYEDRTCIIVTEVAVRGGRRLMGLVVDAVSEVLLIGADELEATPAVGEQDGLDYITGVAKVKGRVKLLLDVDRIVGAAA